MNFTPRITIVTVSAPIPRGWQSGPVLFAFALLAALAQPARALTPCEILVVEKGRGWPVPLVELRTTHAVRFVSDNAGVIAFDLPELMDRETWLEVIGHGYEVPKDGFGYRGVRLTPQPGKTLRVEVERRNIARRLGRLTGAGIFAESQKLGRELDWPESGIVGCDSVQNAVHRGRLFWAWGDTTLAPYPLGLFDMPGATTKLQPLVSFEPPLRLSFDYFRNEKGAPRSICKMPGDGPTWASGFSNLRDTSGADHLVATYTKIRGHLDAYEIGQAVWNEDTRNFQPRRILWKRKSKGEKPPQLTEGHPTSWKDADGREWLLYGNPFPHLRHPATFEAWQDEKAWEHLQPPATLTSSDDRQIKPHTGSIAWNAWRKRWVTIFMENGGNPSAFGELWYAEADSPLGPWGRAVKVLTHDDYTFYNPKIQPTFTPADSPILIFEGTYTREFSGNQQPTPRANYNQVLYRLDLDDPALAPAQQR